KASTVLLAPSRADSVDLHRRIGGPILVNSTESHHPAISQRGYRGIPASMGHVLHVGEGIVRRIEDRGLLNSSETVGVENGPGIDKRAPVRQHQHAITEHVPGNEERDPVS